MSLTRRRVQSAAADMTELINPRPVHDGQGSGSSNEGSTDPKDRRTLRRALLSFQRPLGGVDGSRRLLPACVVTKKAPRREGPDMGPAVRRPKLGSSLRGCSSRKPLQERPRSIDPDAPNSPSG